MQTAKILAMLNEFAPFGLAEEWDHVGLMVGSKEISIQKILFCLDVTEQVIDEAIEEKADLILSHHPFFFESVKRLDWSDQKAKEIQKIIKHDISVISAHTNLDSSKWGLNAVLAQRIGLKEHRPLMAKFEGRRYKLAVYVPDSHAEEVKKAMFGSGAGKLGNYSECSFEISGIGQFKPNRKANPYLGSNENLERVKEQKIEVLIMEKDLASVQLALKRAHPYEEPAYEIYEILQGDAEHGLGVVGKLSEGMTTSDFVKKTKEVLSLSTIVRAGAPKEYIKTVAICTGSGAGFIDQASKRGADVLLTGDLKYHEAQKAFARGLMVIDAGHYGTEIFSKEILYDYFQEKLQKEGERPELIQSKVEENYMVFE
ncbi:MAG TPA: Nif3-like dinuclear metal center hexameric protein [Eubacteriaceae bacterium]|nr:Nif3-like dinuclear metal center hexameric protein [Eubacteriaceae bacterium]